MNNLILRLPGPAVPMKKIQYPFAGSPLRLFFNGFSRLSIFIVFGFLLVLWFFAPFWLRGIDGTAGNVDQSIWLLIVLSLIAFMLVTGLCWWLLQRFWLVAGLPPLEQLVSQFNTLELWQQLGFYWLSFVSLLLAALASLMAIC